ncbi:hypothetical protein BDW66DRAFT_30435 [Aspergillus desertorum]
MLGSDGSQQEGIDADGARIAVANNPNVKPFIDNNDVTIAGHPCNISVAMSWSASSADGMRVVRAQERTWIPYKVRCAATSIPLALQ